mmetsp:Transcript_341/g.542  ORF Transcript_341/g.542 Transcript_341/m.542 type:complete len:554 (+) Transcript_341:177-1838(+)|eukprot:CAMPEP_0195520662 /NCGR_PEP_ID=MMETSP0794_2-20130614/17394_1 /TAXON_ID=515487 /ORGANISM="Stephanopyxis turris, Strain CCMP 815" /LENGTH=553 /DNA_ID=CAMNT_0040650073 /DNA_START=161 /DNA_END=1822 /DNA_ORIENTATION=-
MTTSSSDTNAMVIHVRMGPSGRFTIPVGSDSNESSAGTSSIVITSSTTILQVKEMIAVHPQSEHCPVERQRLIYRGRILSENEKTLAEYGLREQDETVHLVKGSVQPVGGNSSSGAAGSNSNVSATRSSNPSGMANPMSMMNDPLGMMNDPAMQAMMNNPEAMSNMMNSPMMQSVMSNPDMLMGIMNSNPQMRQLMDSNPQLRHILSDPAIMEQTMQAMRDPSLMQNQMRNQDLAMSQIENHPGGWQALRRMYEEVQEPMMEAMSGGNNGTGQGNSNSSTLNSNVSSAGAMPNPWGSATSSSSSTPSPTSTGGSGAMTNPWSSPSGSNNSSANNSLQMPMMPPPNMAQMMAGAGAGQPQLNMEQTIQMLENPAVQAMMNQFTSNPEMMRSMFESNPMLRQMRESNPVAASMMENPEFMRGMMDPNMLRMMMNMQGLQQGANSGAGAMAGTNVSTNAATPAVPSVAPGGLDFSSLLIPQMQSTSISSPSPQRNNTSSGTDTSSGYQSQVAALVDMGFDNRENNLRALNATHGNINRAVEWLLNNPSPPSNTGGN